MSGNFSVPTCSNSSIEPKPKRLCISGDIYDSGDSDYLEEELDSENSSISLECSDEGTIESESSIGSNMEMANECDSNVYLAKDNTKWFDAIDTSKFVKFSSTNPQIKSGKCDHCVNPIGMCFRQYNILYGLLFMCSVHYHDVI